jgi:HPt (histidine-containing phosphotransfer) domain-containing protein
MSPEIAAEVAAMPAAYQALAERFVPSAAARLRTLARSIEARSLQDILRDVHNLKGTCGSYGLLSVQGALAELEEELPVDIRLLLLAPEGDAQAPLSEVTVDELKARVSEVANALAARLEA